MDGSFSVSFPIQHASRHWQNTRQLRWLGSKSVAGLHSLICLRFFVVGFVFSSATFLADSAFAQQRPDVSSEQGWRQPNLNQRSAGVPAEAWTRSGLTRRTGGTGSTFESDSSLPQSFARPNERGYPAQAYIAQQPASPFNQGTLSQPPPMPFSGPTQNFDGLPDSMMNEPMMNGPINQIGPIGAGLSNPSPEQWNNAIRQRFRETPFYDEGIAPFGPNAQDQIPVGGSWFDEPFEEPYANTNSPEMFPMSGIQDRPNPMLPPLTLQAELLPKVDLIGMEAYRAASTIPIFFLPGSPPPFLSGGFEYRNIDAPDSFDLPSSLYTASLGVSLVSKLTNGWYMRLSLDGAYASDRKNQSSDAWQLRGSGFLLIPYRDQWIFLLGGVATGRRDIPVIPAVGALWTPRFDRRVELLFPRPRVSMLLRESDNRQDWLYLGAAFGGGTWAYQQNNGTDDLLTYREWRVMLGWENIAPVRQGQFMSFGRTYSLEVGYVFGRQFEFERGRSDFDLGETAVLRALIRY